MDCRKTEIERIIRYSEAFGPSGFEDEVTEMVKEDLADLKPEEDHMRNVRCVLNRDSLNQKPKVMLDSHLDEVGLIVQAVRPNGTMDFLPLGGIIPANLPSSLFLVENSEGNKVKAIVAAKPPHFMSVDEKNKAPSIENMVLDCGSISREQTENIFKLDIASPAVPDVKCEYHADTDLFYGKAFDNRIGIAAEIEVLKRLKGIELPCVVQGAFSVQEEVGERGVYANYKALHPDVMIAFEGCPADDTFQEPYLIQAGLFKGPMLRDYDVSMITNRRFQKFAMNLAEQKGIPVQRSVRKGGGTDGGRIYPEGCPSIIIGIPVRYIHSSNCICTFHDYEKAVELAVELCKVLDQEIVKSF